MHRRKKVLALLVLCCYGLTLTGCWDKKEFNKISMVSAMAIDRQEDDQYLLTVQVMMPKNLQEGGENSPIWILQGQGETIQSAVDDINARSPRKVNWGHMNVVILGEKALEKDVHRTLDFFARGREFRRRNFFVAAEGDAREILEAAPELAELNTFYLSSIIEDQEGRIGHSAVTFNDMMLALNTKSEALYLPCIKLVEDQSSGMADQSSGGATGGQSQGGASAASGGESSGGKKENSKKLLELSGGAILDADHLVGWQDAQWQKGYYWVRGSIKEGSITLVNPLMSGEDLLSFSILRSKGKISLAREEPLTMKIEVSATLNVAEDTRREFENMINGSLEDKKKLEEAFDREVTEQIAASLEQAQQLGADVFGFSEYLTAYHPEIAQHIDWEKFFQDLQFEIEVQGKLKPSAIIN